MSDDSNSNDAGQDSSTNAAQDSAGQDGAAQDSTAEIASLRAQLAASEAAKTDVIQDRNTWKAKAQTQGKPAADTAGAQPGAGDTAADPMTQVLEKLNAQTQHLEQLEKRFADQLDAGARMDATASLLDGITPGQLDTAKLMLDGLRSRGTDITSPEGLEAAREQLTNTPSLFVATDRGTQLHAPQRGADGKINFDVFTHIDEVPPDLIPEALADPAVADRLLGLGGTSNAPRRRAI